MSLKFIMSDIIKVMNLMNNKVLQSKRDKIRVLKKIKC